MKQRIAFITPNLPHYRITFFEKLFMSFDADWVLFHGLKSKDDGRPKYEGVLNIENKTFTSKAVKLGPYGIVFNKGLFQQVRQFDPDVIICVGIPGEITNRIIMKWASTKGIKIILWICGWESGEVKGVYQTVKNYLVKRFFQFADYHIAYGTWAKDYISRITGRSDNISIAYNGIEIDHLYDDYKKNEDKGQLLRQEAGLTESDILFIYVGAINASKKVNLLIEAFEQLSKSVNNVKLWIVGDGPEKDNLEILANASSVTKEISFKGRIINGVDKYFSAADCFVLPGAGGLAINEAMFWKTPCIVSFADGTEKDLVDTNTGFFFKRNCAASLAEKMLDFTNLIPGQRRLMGEHAKKIIEEQSNVTQMVEVFKKTISSL